MCPNPNPNLNPNPKPNPNPNPHPNLNPNPNPKPNPNPNPKVLTFYKAGSNLVVTLKPYQTPEHVRAAVCRKFGCTPEEVRLVLKVCDMCI